MSQPNKPPTADSPVEAWLLSTPGDSQMRLEKVVTRASAVEHKRGRPLQGLGTAARRALVEEIEAKLRTVIGETVVDVIMAGWHAYAAVAQAIRKSRTQRGVDQIVPLRKHTITAPREHTFDIELDGVRVMSLSVQFVVTLQLYDAVAVVIDGHVVAIRSGQAKADAKVSVEDVQIAHKTLTFPLEAELALHASASSIQRRDSEIRWAG
jgi:hypothetical protein